MLVNISKSISDELFLP